MTASVIDLMVARRRVLVRVDWNVACDEAGTITDDFRIRASLPTIRLLRKKKAQKIILAAHFVNPVERIGEGLERTIAGNRRLTFAVVAKHAAQLLHLPDINPKLVILPGSPLPAYELAPDLILLENLRFYTGEEKNDDEEGRQICGF